jgi:XTP/dITP diphosphohydrolase
MAEQLVFATGNPAKLGQLRYVVAQYRFELTILSAVDLFGAAGRYDEVGQSPGEIAAHGAATVADRVGRPVLTEDTIFAVDALAGRPGLTAGVFLKEHGRRGILQVLQGQGDRRASITSAVAYAEPGREPVVWERTLAGRITQQERWTLNLPDWIAPSPAAPLGGGYNAIFIPAGETRTLAQIPPAEALDIGYREPLFYAALLYMTRQRGLTSAP